MPGLNNPPDKGDPPDKGTGITGGAGFSLDSIEDEELREFAQRKFGSSIEGMTPQEIALKALEMQRNQEKLHSKQEGELGSLRKQINEIASGRVSPELDKQNQPNIEEGGLSVEDLDDLGSKLTRLDELSEKLSKFPDATKEIETIKKQAETMLNNMKNSMSQMNRFDSLASMRNKKIIAEMIEEDFNLLKGEFEKDKDGEKKAFTLVEKLLPYLHEDPKKNPLGEKTQSFLDIAWSRPHPLLAVRDMFFPKEIPLKPSPSEGGGKSSIPGDQPSEPAEKKYLDHLVDLTNKDFVEGVTR